MDNINTEAQMVRIKMAREKADKIITPPQQTTVASQAETSIDGLL